MTKRIRVIMPEWWSQGNIVYGYTDGVDTYCCESQPSWFVEVTSCDYEGYFYVKDLEIVKHSIGARA